MSGTYTEIDLDDPKKDSELEAEFEIVEEEAEGVVEKPAPKAEGEEEEEEKPEGPKQRLSRSQRLKAQRDAFAQQLADARAELERERSEKQKLQGQNEEAATAGYAFYIQTVDESMKGLRAQFDKAFDAGDRDLLFEVQQKMAELAAEKKAAQREAAARPTKPAAGGEDQKPATRQTTEETKSQQPQASSQKGAPNPLAVEWATRHKDWFNKNPVMTMAARVIDSQLAQDGFDPNEPEYFDELDKRLREEFPHRFEKTEPPKKTVGPTVQNRANTLAPGSKVKVVVTAADRELARRLNISVEEYAKQKARREAAANSVSGYTEIV